MTAGVFYVPPRVPLYPFRAWLPWDIDSIPRELDGFVSTGVLHAAGPTKADGSPDMRSTANKDVRRITSPPGVSSTYASACVPQALFSGYSGN